MTKERLLHWVEAEVKRLGSQEAAARYWGVSPQYLSDILRGRREPGERVLAAWGMRKRVEYERVEDKS